MSYAVFSPSPISDFTVILTYSAPLTYSWLNSTHVLTFCYYSSCVYLFAYLSICSPFFPSTPFCYLSTTSCFTLWSFFVPCVPFHHSLSLHVNISCMWFYLCLATSFPSRPLPYLVIFLVFDSTPISIIMTTPYESDSVYNKLQSCISSLVC